MRNLLIVSSIVLLSAAPARAETSFEIGIHMPDFPQLVVVPGYPVYYAPQSNANYFFYDGVYWVYRGDNWYASSWYNGPWHYVSPEHVPLYVLRVPVRYYHRPPPHFHRWHRDAPPRWHKVWGRDWAKHRRGWDRWDRRAVPPPAPLPAYQRQYSGERYPHAPEHQYSIRNEHYRYQPREPVAQQHFHRPVPGVPAPQLHQPMGPAHQPHPAAPAQQPHPAGPAHQQHPWGSAQPQHPVGPARQPHSIAPAQQPQHATPPQQRPAGPAQQPHSAGPTHQQRPAGPAQQPQHATPPQQQHPAGPAQQPNSAGPAQQPHAQPQHSAGPAQQNRGGPHEKRNEERR